MNKYLSDYHIHSSHSFDSKENIENIIQSALLKNISEICMTEHVSFDKEDKSYNTFDFQDYRNEILSLNEKYKNKIIIKSGIEAGECHLYKNEFNEYFKKNSLDFIIGSVHNINKKGLRTNIREFGIEASYENYFKEVLNFVQNGDFDVLGHLDLIQRYAFESGGIYKFEDYKNYIYEILKIVIAKNKGIEVNTSGLANNLLFPKVQIIKMYKDMGGEIITVGSDAHAAMRVGENIGTVYELLKECSFKYVYTFTQREPSGIRL